MISFQINSVEKRKWLITYLDDTYKEYFFINESLCLEKKEKSKPSIIFNHRKLVTEKNKWVFCLRMHFSL